MKTPILLIVCFFLSLTSFSQNRIGIDAGITILSDIVAGESDTTYFNPNLGVELIFNIPRTKEWKLGLHSSYFSIREDLGPIYRPFLEQDIKGLGYVQYDYWVNSLRNRLS